MELPLENIWFRCDKTAYLSVWSFDPPTVTKGEIVQVVSAIIVAEDPLYGFLRENGRPFAAKRSALLPYGEFFNDVEREPYTYKRR